MKKFISVFVAVVTALSFTGCGQTATSENKNLEKVTVVLDWTPNTNHTGLYVAKEKGYFEDAGLDVEIQQPPEDGATLMVSSGKAQFGIDFQEYLAPAFKPGEEMNVSAVAAIIQHNTSGLISLKEKGIDSPKKLEGKTYATWDMDIEKSIIKHIMTKDGGDYSKLNMIPSTIQDVKTALTTNQVDTVWVYYAWDGIALEQAGLDTNFINFAEQDENLDFYSPVIIANNDYIKNNPEQAKAFVQAAKKGYEFAEKNPKEAADILCKNAPELDKDIVERSQEWLADKYTADSESWGYIDPKRWNGFYNWLYDTKAINYKISENTGFTDDLLK